MPNYRYPNEHLILSLTLVVVVVVIAVTATATVCGSVVFVAFMVGFAYLLNQVHTDDLIKTAQPISPAQTPRLAVLVQQCAARLRPGSFNAFVAPSAALNAYTFGLTEPRKVVVFSALVEVMDEDELRFIVGHELGHIALGHTWLNSLVGGLAGVPSPYMAAALLYFIFRWWNRACEYSADRAGLLACGQPEMAYSALLKLRGLRAQPGLELATDLADQVGETLATHPLLAKRIENLRRWAASADYPRCRAQVEQLAEKVA